MRDAAAPWAGWKALGVPEFSQVPVGALSDSPLEVWATALLHEARSELDDLCGDLLIECYDEPTPSAGTEPAFSAQVPLGPGT
ncbi:hypothetical protein [Streptomyces camelliae]|uniref:Uncharacterized protein n=1 Tax=Streptomyces camelliae TaxID=3004093 RepID=A0ABY7P0W8_9ACTN|nr:hypothetical protein [Streptomyces sp. HUAS 2-6]WBO64146.1 hypothetical protein O1G22_15575 [Streptomyces sp. HUAS 2-6]